MAIQFSIKDRKIPQLLEEAMKHRGNPPILLQYLHVLAYNGSNVTMVEWVDDDVARVRFPNDTVMPINIRHLREGGRPYVRR